MNLKRFGALTLSAALTLSLLSGCKTEGGAGSSSGSGAVSGSSGASGTMTVCTAPHWRQRKWISSPGSALKLYF